MANNPSAVQNLLQMMGGESPKELFYTKCKEMDIDPESLFPKKYEIILQEMEDSKKFLTDSSRKS